MSSLDSILTSTATLSPEVVRIFAWTLLHFLWQGALVAGGLAVALTALRQRGPGLRYAVALSALLAMVALPLATGSFLASRLDLSTTAQFETATVVHNPSSVHPGIVGAQITMPRAPQPSAGNPMAYLEPYLPALVLLWMVGVALLSVLHYVGWARVRRLRRQSVQRAADRWQVACQTLAQQLGIRRSVELLESTLVRVPTVIGWLKPAILVPASTLSGLTPQQLESILAHELGHVRRHDFAVNALQVAVETLLFYHPAVWWVSREIRTLREHCCDDLAVEICGDRMTYARALADLEDLRFAAPVFALGADGGPLLQRIRRLVRGDEPTRSSGWVAGTLAATALVTSATLLALTSQPSQAQETDEASETIRVVSPLVAPPVIIAQLPEEPSGPPAPPRAPQPPTPPAPPVPLDELIAMKIHGVDHLLEDLADTSYANLPTAQLVELAKFGVDAELITELGQSGFDDLSTAELVELARYGVDADYVQEMKTAGHAPSSTHDLATMAKFGVDADFITELANSGLGALQMAELIELVKYGIDGDYIQEMKAAGYDLTTPDELATMAKFGVDADLVAELTNAGFDSLQTAEIVELAKFGIDGDYIQEIQEAGYDLSSTNDLAEMAKFGVDADLVAELTNAGFDSLQTAEIVELAKFGIDGDYIQEMQEAGYDLSSTNDLAEMAKFGVDADLVAELTNAGYGDLASQEIAELARFGVDGDFIRELREAGVSDLSIEDLTRMARHGIDAEFITKMNQHRRADN